MRHLSLSTTAAAVLALACTAPGAALAASDASTAALLAQIERLTARIEALEQQNKAMDKALESERISEQEPELVTRVKAVEQQVAATKKSTALTESLSGLSAGFSLTTVAQRPSRSVSLPGSQLDGEFGHSQLNYRADAYVEVPLESMGNIDHKVYGQLRFGQGDGLNGGNTFAAPNASAFRVSATNPDDAVGVLAQAWYQASIPLPLGGFKPHSKQTLEVTFGKLDLFGFFDQNQAAGDETRQFLNTAFVHNPLLDAGGDIGADSYGFAPGLHLSYLNHSQASEPWRLSLGLFGAGQGANYERVFSSPLLMAQAETQLRLFGGLNGNYRLYYWRTGQAPHFDASAEPAHRSGWGLSVDQRVSDSATVFGRYGQHIQGAGARFDKALTGGVEFTGSAWGRGSDALGLAAGWLQSSTEFRNASAQLPGDNNLLAYGYQAQGAEHLFETYYRWRVNKQFEISPSLQYFGHPGANPDAKPYYILSLRAQLSY
ncbi:carbohydrate porin [Acidovorax sp. HDW3]|uniref:carbohydrate porin n=1 Tax=Acidovorax sp. HDW3 TaxID=2714923 RepID=UPI0014084FA5|nr:carbohydrate porin [Acidovorax sp. HDW3]QIL43571.1 carbohydrate porin [Acidovorax sp. HDW3]